MCFEYKSPSHKIVLLIISSIDLLLDILMAFNTISSDIVKKTTLFYICCNIATKWP
jgi:hypothetical protein